MNPDGGARVVSGFIGNPNEFLGLRNRENREEERRKSEMILFFFCFYTKAIRHRFI